jgi:hypothetical protein
MYGTSAANVHFTGTSQVAALLLIRSILPATSQKKVELEVKATPVALGTGFWKSPSLVP